MGYKEKNFIRFWNLSMVFCLNTIIGYQIIKPRLQKTEHKLISSIYIFTPELLLFFLHFLIIVTSKDNSPNNRDFLLSKVVKFHQKFALIHTYVIWHKYYSMYSILLFLHTYVYYVCFIFIYYMFTFSMLDIIVTSTLMKL